MGKPIENSWDLLLLATTECLVLFSPWVCRLCGAYYVCAHTTLQCGLEEGPHTIQHRSPPRRDWTGGYNNAQYFTSTTQRITCFWPPTHICQYVVPGTSSPRSKDLSWKRSLRENIYSKICATFSWFFKNSRSTKLISRHSVARYELVDLLFFNS